MPGYPADLRILVGLLVLIVGLFVIATSAYVWDLVLSSSCSLLAPCAEDLETGALMLFGFLLSVIGGYTAVSAAARNRWGRRG